MSPTLCAFLSLFCMFGCMSAKQCTFHDEMSLIQERARALTPDKKWPDIGKIIDKAKEAADSATDAAKKVNDTVQDSMNGAANATKTAIDMIVKTVQAGLDQILSQADTFGNTTQQAVDGFLTEMRESPDLQTLEEAANQTLDAADASFMPLMSALNTSIGAVQNILKASGFLHLSEEMGNILTQAMVPINKTREMIKQSKQTLSGLDAKVNESAGKISSEVDTDLKFIMNKIHEVAEEVNSTFVPKTLEAYNTLVSHLKATVEGVLPLEYLNQVVLSLQQIEPIVQNVSDSVARPLQTLDSGFNEGINLVRENVQSSARGAINLSLFSFVISMCASLIAL